MWLSKQYKVCITIQRKALDQFCATQVFVVKESELFICSAWKAIMEQSLTCVETLLPKELILKISLSKNYVWP